MTNTEASFIRAALEAIRAKSAHDLSSAVLELSSFTFKEAPDDDIEEFSDDFVEELLDVIGTGEFLEMPESFRLLMLFQNDWGRMNHAQRSQVCGVLEQQYERIRDHTSQLVIVELLGEYLCDRFSFDALNRLRRVQDETARAHVAHGFGLLIRNTQDESVKSEATRSLRSMAKDTSSIVSQEATGELARLGGAG